MPEEDREQSVAAQISDLFGALFGGSDFVAQREVRLSRQAEERRLRRESEDRKNRQRALDQKDAINEGAELLSRADPKSLLGQADPSTNNDPTAAALSPDDPAFKIAEVQPNLPGTSEAVSQFEDTLLPEGLDADLPPSVLFQKSQALSELLRQGRQTVRDEDLAAALEADAQRFLQDLRLNEANFDRLTKLDIDRQVAVHKIMSPLERAEFSYRQGVAHAFDIDLAQARDEINDEREVVQAVISQIAVRHANDIAERLKAGEAAFIQGPLTIPDKSGREPPARSAAYTIETAIAEIHTIYGEGRFQEGIVDVDNAIMRAAVWQALESRLDPKSFRVFLDSGSNPLDTGAPKRPEVEGG